MHRPSGTPARRRALHSSSALWRGYDFSADLHADSAQLNLDSGPELSVTVVQQCAALASMAMPVLTETCTDIRLLAVRSSSEIFGPAWQPPEPLLIRWLGLGKTISKRHCQAQPLDKVADPSLEFITATALQENPTWK